MNHNAIKPGEKFHWEVSRRKFLTLSAATAGALAAGGIPFMGDSESTPAVGRSTHLPPVKFDREVYTLCEQCVWRCGVRAKVLDGKIYKLDGNPNHPHSNGMLC